MSKPDLFVCLSSCDFYIFNFFLSILMVIISLELTRVNPDRNIFSINVLLFYSTEVWSITITEFRNFKYFDLNLLEMSKSSLILLPTYLPTSLSFPFPPVSYHPPSLYLLYMSLDRTRTSR